MSPGHLIPMVDIARLIATHRIKVSIATTPHNISRFKSIFSVTTPPLRENCRKKERGNKASIEKDKILTWLDSRRPNEVLYVCFGSLCVFAKSQVLEIGLGLEASKKSFIWVIKDNIANQDGALPEGFEERVKDRGLIIRGWAPQVLILNHSAVGGFMTHCGWNSVLESVTAGVPLITWPLFGEQFYNDDFVVNRLGIGVRIGVESGLAWGEEEEIGALVKWDRVEETVNLLMGGGEAVEEMRKRVSQLGELAKLALVKGGSSDVNIGRLIKDLLSLKEEKIRNTPNTGS